MQEGTDAETQPQCVIRRFGLAATVYIFTRSRAGPNIED